LHHVIPYARGGATTLENLELRCAAHNKYEAEQTFGLFVRERAAIYSSMANPMIIMDSTEHLRAASQSNQGRHDRKRDFPAAERLVKPLVAHELTFSFVPGCYAACLADGDPAQVSADAQSRAAAQGPRIPPRRSAHQDLDGGV
jgi:hypothetical protein